MSAIDTPGTAATPVAATAPIAGQSAVSWAAILAGAAAAAALSLVLLILGMGLGLSSVSPWAFEGISREAFGWSTIVWITFTSIAASGLGGYLCGRLRTRWVGVHVDESYFRDTAHGFLSWAVATLLTAAVLTSAIGAILGTGAKAVGAAGGAAVTAAGGGVVGSAATVASDQELGGLEYWVDSMFRRSSGDPGRRPELARETTDAEDTPAISPTAMTSRPEADDRSTREDVRPEILRIVRNALSADALDREDSRYVAQRVAEHTGLALAQAQARVDEVEARLRAALEQAETSAREAADEAREASAYAALWLFITLLIGAFVASLFATFGGRQRDH